MPKMKTHSGAKKRFKLTAKGKVKARHAFTSHILEKKSPAHKKRRKVLEQAKGYWGRKSTHYRYAKEQVEHSLVYAYRDRKNKKRNFRRLWITRINAAARLNGLSYGEFIHGLKLAEIDLDRKVLADIAVRDPETFRRFAEAAREASAAAA